MHTKVTHTHTHLAKSCIRLFEWKMAGKYANTIFRCCFVKSCEAHSFLSYFVAQVAPFAKLIGEVNILGNIVGLVCCMNYVLQWIYECLRTTTDHNAFEITRKEEKKHTIAQQQLQKYVMCGVVLVWCSQVAAHLFACVSLFLNTAHGHKFSSFWKFLTRWRYFRFASKLAIPPKRSVEMTMTGDGSMKKWERSSPNAPQHR